MFMNNFLPLMPEKQAKKTQTESYLWNFGKGSVFCVKSCCAQSYNLQNQNRTFFRFQTFHRCSRQICLPISSGHPQKEKTSSHAAKT